MIIAPCYHRWYWHCNNHTPLTSTPVVVQLVRVISFYIILSFIIIKSCCKSTCFEVLRIGKIYKYIIAFVYGHKKRERSNENIHSNVIWYNGRKRFQRVSPWTSWIYFKHHRRRRHFLLSSNVLCNAALVIKTIIDNDDFDLIDVCVVVVVVPCCGRRQGAYEEE